MLGNLLNRFLNKIDNYYKKIASFFSIILYIIFLCVFHQAYYTILILIPAILLIMNKYHNNKYFKEEDLLVIVFSITLAFIMKFIISYFNEFNILTCISISIIITGLISLTILSISVFIAFLSKPLFHYLNID